MQSTTEVRKITLSGEIDKKSVKDVYEYIISMNDEDYYLLDSGVSNLVPIRLYIDSYGGEVEAALGLIGVMAESITPINTYALGTVMSAALPIYLMGGDRYSIQTAHFMYHDVSNCIWGKMEDVLQSASYSVHLRETMDSIILQRSKIRKSKLNKVVKSKQDWYFTASEAVELNVVNREGF